MPKYGFPVDVVELQIMRSGRLARTLELQRDLKLAVGEYAPGSHVVARGKVWESTGLKVQPERAWPRYSYQVCDNCGFYCSVLTDSEEKLPENCNACGSPFEHTEGKFVVPEFGFVSDKPPQDAGRYRPRRLYGSRPYFAGGNPEETAQCELEWPETFLVVRCLHNAKLATINRAPFSLCTVCGKSLPTDSSARSQTHRSPWQSDCRGKPVFANLGHELLTDAARLSSKLGKHAPKNEDGWLSLLYALLNATSDVLNVPSADLDACLYPFRQAGAINPDLVIFDDVPGGAGHTLRLSEERTVERVIEAARKRMDRCTCEMSCYGCLRSYQNQYFHDRLDRRSALRALNAMQR